MVVGAVCKVLVVVVGTRVLNLVSILCYVVDCHAHSLVRVSDLDRSSYINLY